MKFFKKQIYDYGYSRRVVNTLFNIKIKEKIEDCKEKNVTCFGIIDTYKSKNSGYSIKICKIFGFPIYKTDEFNWKKKYYVFNFKIFERDLRKNFFVSNNIDFPKTKLKTCYAILYGNSGESFTAGAYIIKCLQKKYDEVRICVCNDIQEKMCKLFYPDLKYYRIKSTKSGNYCFSYKNIDVLHLATEYPGYFDNYEKNDFSHHVFDNILKNAKITRQECEKAPIVSSQTDIESFKQNINNMKIKLDNFIVLAPEAKSSIPLPRKFWEKLANELKQLGFDVYLNIKDRENSIDGCEDKFLKYSDLVQLIPYAKATISLRSGLSEVFSYFDIPNYVIYTNFATTNPQYSKEIVDAYKIKKYPYRDSSNTFEYFYEDNIDKIVDEIINNIKNKEYNCVKG